MRQYYLGVDESTALMSLSHNETASSSRSFCASISVSAVFTLSREVLWDSLLFIFF